MEQSLTNVNNRMQMKTKHRCGSKSIPIIANGEVPDLAKFYKSIHYNSNTHEWISSESQANYDNMIKTQAEHLSQTGVIPLSQEELSVKVLKPRSGYVKGLGLRPSSSMKTTVVPAENSDYVQRLEMQIAQQNEQIARSKCGDDDDDDFEVPPMAMQKKKVLKKKRAKVVKKFNLILVMMKTAMKAIQGL
ncbi:uncharacterized protein LOC114261821 [Camellia sinensis]|uniref:uncharacterized protein LOC114261821 n=1 Tax=Camellia sinensis TaxID=4442 RepID=UPI0010365D9A|nr:uncharacterized protein LOC114261821 [Camellia sinensis]